MLYQVDFQDCIPDKFSILSTVIQICVFISVEQLREALPIAILDDMKLIYAISHMGE